MTRLVPGVLLAGLLAAAVTAPAAELDRPAVAFTPPDEITGVRNAAGTNESAVRFGAPSKPGPCVVRLTYKVHYDGAKDEETIIQVWGMGPATSTPAEKR